MEFRKTLLGTALNSLRHFYPFYLRTILPSRSSYSVLLFDLEYECLAGESPGCD